MSQVAELKAGIAARKYKSMELSGEIDRKIRDIKAALSGYPLTKIKDLRLKLIAQLALEAETLQATYLNLLAEIELAEKELAE
jgi:hypothetical protein